MGSSKQVIRYDTLAACCSSHQSATLVAAKPGRAVILARKGDKAGAMSALNEEERVRRRLSCAQLARGQDGS